MNGSKKSAHKETDSMPGIIIEYASNEKTTEAQNIKKKKTILWIMVTAIFAVVVTMWILNLNTLFFNVKNAPKNETNLIETAKKELTGALEEVKLKNNQTDEQKGVIDQIKDILSNITTSTKNNTTASGTIEIDTNNSTTTVSIEE